MYMLDTVLLKQEKLAILDITRLLFRFFTQMKAYAPQTSPEYSCQKETCYIQYGPLLLFQ